MQVDVKVQLITQVYIFISIFSLCAHKLSLKYETQPTRKGVLIVLYIMRRRFGNVSCYFLDRLRGEMKTRRVNENRMKYEARENTS